MNSQAEGDYLLGTDYEELRRLQMQHWTWQPETVDLWDPQARLIAPAMVGVIGAKF